MCELSILIPSRNEMFLKNTIEDIILHAESDYEIIVVLDGQWPVEPLDQHDRVHIIYHPESIGQRAATNEAARISSGKYLMKVDAHCAFDQGFDVKMLQDMQPDWTMIPVMRNLHAFDWVCPNGHRRYQGPSGNCLECGEPTTRDVVWIAKPSPQSTAYRFDKSMHFQYWNEYKSKQVGDLVETLSIQGSCFLVSREKYFELDLCDENHGSWGQQGVEVALKTWLSGGRVIVTKKTWYAHMFRTQGGDFSFPYPQSGKDVEKARKYSRDLWLNDRWDKAIHPLSWLINKFDPVPDWDKSWGVIYYTDNELDPEIMTKCQRQLKRCIGNHRLISISLKPIDFGENICLPLKRGKLTMFKQILAGLKELDTDYVFFAEHDVVYHPSHFLFAPPKEDVYYYNVNVWKVRYSDGHGLHYEAQQVSGLCGNRELLIRHYENKIKEVEANGYNNRMGYEPGSHEGIRENWKSEWPIIDIRHDKNLTPSRWTKDEFRDKRYTEGWIEQDNIPGWGHMWHWWKRL